MASRAGSSNGCLALTRVCELAGMTGLPTTEHFATHGLDLLEIKTTSTDR